jgi:hypothetical protein
MDILFVVGGEHMEGHYKPSFLSHAPLPLPPELFVGMDWISVDGCAFSQIFYY